MNAERMIQSVSECLMSDVVHGEKIDSLQDECDVGEYVAKQIVFSVSAAFSAHLVDENRGLSAKTSRGNAGLLRPP